MKNLNQNRRGAPSSGWQVSNVRDKMKVLWPLTICLLLSFPSFADEPEREFAFPSQYWYRSDLFCDVNFIGDIEIIGTLEGFTGETVTKYKFRIKEIVTHAKVPKLQYRVGDTFTSETYRKITTGSAIICLGSYPTPDKIVIDGAFPLMLSDVIKKAFKIVRKNGVDLEKYSQPDFDAVKILMRDPEMSAFLRNKRREQGGGGQPDTR